MQPVTPIPHTCVDLEAFCCCATPPPCSTLFPYTTLFRSPRRLRLRGQPVEAPLLEGAAVEGRLRVGPRVVHARRDRKSTRLNSSHPSISYAVFCLKKKIEGISIA